MSTADIEGIDLCPSCLRCRLVSAVEVTSGILARARDNDGCIIIPPSELAEIAELRDVLVGQISMLDAECN